MDRILTVNYADYRWQCMEDDCFDSGVCHSDLEAKAACIAHLRDKHGIVGRSAIQCPV